MGTVSRATCHRGAAEITEHVTPVQRGNRTAAIHKAAGRRKTPRAPVLRDWGDGADAIGPQVALKELAPSKTAPAVVAAAYDQVHFLERALADVVEPQLPAVAIEAPAPRVAEAVGVDLADS